VFQSDEDVTAKEQRKFVRLRKMVCLETEKGITDGGKKITITKFPKPASITLQHVHFFSKLWP